MPSPRATRRPPVPSVAYPASAPHAIGSGITGSPAYGISLPSLYKAGILIVLNLRSYQVHSVVFCLLHRHPHLAKTPCMF